MSRRNPLTISTLFALVMTAHWPASAQMDQREAQQRADHQLRVQARAQQQFEAREAADRQRQLDQPKNGS